MSTILTRSGRLFDYLNLEDNDVTISDIAWALAHTCRFGGHSSYFYSVAQHSVFVSHLAPSGFKYDALMHDASEAFVCDLPSPLKKLIPEYKKLENEVSFFLAKKFSVSFPLPEEVHYADWKAFGMEQQVLFPEFPDKWNVKETFKLNKELKYFLKPVSPERAYERFMQFYKLER